MKRILYTSTNKCPFGCYYCFSKFSQYKPEKLPSITQVQNDKNRDIINYPACDYDLFALENPFEILEKLTDTSGSISISTKALLDDDMISNLKTFNERFQKTNSILKVGISVTSKFSLSKDEPNAAEYEDRIENAKSLKRNGIYTVLVLKPLLKKTPIAEYRTIINDFSDHVHAVLVGHQYIDENLIDNKDNSFLKRRAVNWLPGKPIWPCYDMNHYIHLLENYCRELDIPCFSSDRDIMSYLINNNQLPKRMSV